MTIHLNQPLPLLESDVLRTFIAIAETGSFSAAATTVFRTPSAVSMQIKKMEDMLGRPVFERDSRSVRLTSDGEILLSYARKILTLNREAVSRFIVQDIRGIVKLGTPDDIGERIIPDVLHNFAKCYPDVVIDVVVDTSTKLREMIGQGKLDLTLLTCPFEAVAKGDEILHSEPLIWATKCGGSAHLCRPLPISMWEEGCAWRTAATKALEAANIEYRVSYMSSHTAGQRAAVLSELAVAPLPLSAIGDNIMAVNEEDGLPVMGNISVSMLVKPDAGNTVTAAADHLRTAFEKLTDQTIKKQNAA